MCNLEFFCFLLWNLFVNIKHLFRQFCHNALDFEDLWLVESLNPWLGFFEVFKRKLYSLLKDTHSFLSFVSFWLHIEHLFVNAHFLFEDSDLSENAWYVWISFFVFLSSDALINLELQFIKECFGASDLSHSTASAARTFAGWLESIISDVIDSSFLLSHRVLDPSRNLWGHLSWAYGLQLSPWLRGFIFLLFLFLLFFLLFLFLRFFRSLFRSFNRNTWSLIRVLICSFRTCLLWKTSLRHLCVQISVWFDLESLHTDRVFINWMLFILAFAFVFLLFLVFLIFLFFLFF